MICANLDRPRLKPGAVPTLFPGCPEYLSVSQSTRESPQHKRERLENRHLENAVTESLNFAEEMKTLSVVSTFEGLLETLKNRKISPYWTQILKDQNVIFAHITFDNGPWIESCVNIDKNLLVTAYFKKKILKSLNGKSLPFVLNNLKDLFLVLDELSEFQDSNEIQNHMLSSVTELLENINSEMENVTLHFFREQLQLLTVPKQCFRYSTELLIFSSLLYSISPHAYKFLRHSGNIILPHPTTIRKLCASLKASPAEEQHNENFLKYAKEKYNLLADCDKTVCLLVDEIHLKPFFDYTGGSILGVSFYGENFASSAHVFMVSSLFSPYRDVVHIVPVKTLTADVLHSLIKKTIIGLEHIGFSVLCVSTDNNSINKKAMSLFACPSQVSIVYPHPVTPGKPLFFVLDPVHILKCIRNNWINQKNHAQCMFYPNFDKVHENIEIKTASFGTLKKLRELEQGDLLKYGRGLTLKALFPSNLERQNVKLVLKIFNEYVITALTELGKKHELVHCDTTAAYINIILQWWKIMNVKNPRKGIHKRDEFMEPLTMNQNDIRREYLQKVLTWLDAWKVSGCDNGILTNETHHAFTHTTHAILELSSYCIQELGMQYFLPGKVQTDPLEERFGKYRQLAGSQYNISIRQMFECESKLRVQNSLTLILKSDKFGVINIKNLDFSESINQPSYKPAFNEIEIPNIFKNLSLEQSDFKNVEQQIPIFGYLAGYCILKLANELKCNVCNNELQIEYNDSNPSHKLISVSDRGGLKYPHNDVVNIIMINYIVVQKLVSDKFENDFLHVRNQRNLVVHLVTCQLTDELHHLDVCDNGHTVEYIINRIIHMTTNTLLKNYCSKKNDIKKNEPSKKRKLSTLQGSKILKSLPK